MDAYKYILSVAGRPEPKALKPPVEPAKPAHEPPTLKETVPALAEWHMYKTVSVWWVKGKPYARLKEIPIKCRR